MAKPGMEMFGDKALAKLFRELGPRVQRRALRPAVSAAATPIVKAAKAKAAKRSGLLKKSLGKKIKTYADKGMVIAVIGPRTGVNGEVNGKKYVPAKIAHLIEKGHIARDGSYVPGQPFLGPAYAETEGQALGVIKDKLAESVVKEAAKAGAA
jgi:HK97 gp10 family phage protein